MDTAKIFTFKQRADELMRALRRRHTIEREVELKDIERQLKEIGHTLIGKLHRKP
jgi:hypothetical protein